METDEILLIKRHQPPPRSYCAKCRQVAMIAPEHAARAVGVNTRKIYAWVEAGNLHFTESPDQSLLVCLESVSAALAAAGNIIGPAANTIKPLTEATTNDAGQAILNLSNIIKSHEQVQAQITVRECKDGKTVVYVLQQGATLPPQDQKCANNDDCKCKDRDGGYFTLSDGDTLDVAITPQAIDVHVRHTASPGSAAPASQTVAPNAFAPIFLLRGFGGVTLINGNAPSAAGFDAAVLFPLGHLVHLGFASGFQWSDSSVVSMAGGSGGSGPSTFINTSVGFKSGNFGGRLGLAAAGWELGLNAGVTVDGSSITQNEGACNTGGSAGTGCIVTSTTKMYGAIVGPYAGPYVSRSIFHHVAVFAEGDFRHQKDGHLFNNNSGSLVGGVVLSFGRE